MIYYAHSDPNSRPPGNPQARWQPLHEHLQNVADQAQKFARTVRPGDQDFAATAYWVGLLHDLGKYTDEFQAYLRAQRSAGRDTHHAAFGAKHAYNSKWCGPAFAIAGHHAGLHDRDHFQTLLADSGGLVASRIKLVLARFSASLSNKFLPAVDSPFVLKNSLTYEFYIRMLLSCLVDADRLDTARFQSGPERRAVYLEAISSVLQERLYAERTSKPSGGLVNSLRNQIFESCLSRATERPGFFTLTAPTGGGKTLSSMAFALAHARRHDLRRIIVVIPYLSIIEQNAADYRRILDPKDEGYVVEHHSAVKTPETKEDRESPSFGELAAENWDAPIIITTSVQFVESLFARSPSRCRKLHNIARSVVILDEVQTLPNQLLNPLLNILRDLKTNYGTSFVFSTATQPAFRHSVNLDEGFQTNEVIELAGANSTEIQTQYQSLQRVRYRQEDSVVWPDLAVRLAGAEFRQVLCIVNLRRHAFELWEALHAALSVPEQESLFHLSSTLCAEHRLWLLGEIKNPRPGSIRHRLREGLSCRLVSTQVVEAGVDLDFPIVYRALGPLDSIIQAAGRCNREGKLKDAKGQPRLGEVVVFKPAGGGVPPGAYETATGHTANFIQRVGLAHIAAHPAYFGQYFTELHRFIPTDSTIQEDRREFRFQEVSRKAKVIEDTGALVVVPWGEGKKVIEAIKTRPLRSGWGFTQHDLRRLQRYTVNVRETDFRKLEAARAISPLLPNLEVFVLDGACYHKHLGVLVARHPMEDLCGV